MPLNQEAVGFRSGFVAVVGRPNVGKSTLVNALVGQKVAIVSDKPQTTRNRILAVVNRPGGQIVLFDTPGIHKPMHRMNERMEYRGFEMEVTDAERTRVNWVRIRRRGSNGG